MLYGIISDIHANLEALGAALGALGSRGVEQILCVGDFVGYGPDPNACVDRLKPRLAASVAGNHDLAITGRLDMSWFNDDARRALKWTARRLRGDIYSYLESLPPRVEYESLLLAHGSPRDPGEEYLLDPYSARSNFRFQKFRLCFVGHAHVPIVFTLDPAGRLDMDEPAPGSRLKLLPGNRYLINVGSVGQPRDGDPRAAWGIYDSDRETVGFYRTPYPVEVTQEKMRGFNLPAALIERLKTGF